MVVKKNVEMEKQVQGLYFKRTRLKNSIDELNSKLAMVQAQFRKTSEELEDATKELDKIHGMIRDKYLVKQKVAPLNDLEFGDYIVEPNRPKFTVDGPYADQVLLDASALLESKIDS